MRGRAFERKLELVKTRNAMMIRAATGAGPCRCGQKLEVRTVDGPDGGVVGSHIETHCPKRRWWNFLAHHQPKMILQF